MSYRPRSSVSKFKTKNLETQNLTKSFYRIKEKRVGKFFREFFPIFVFLRLSPRVLVESFYL